jgi:hypothetical protein
MAVRVLWTAENEPLFKRALAIDEKQLGPDDPNVARFKVNLAVLYRNRRRKLSNLLL